jgi:hypothetical protein
MTKQNNNFDQFVTSGSHSSVDEYFSPLRHDTMHTDIDKLKHFGGSLLPPSSVQSKNSNMNNPEDGRSKLPQNVHNYVPVYEYTLPYPDDYNFKHESEQPVSKPIFRCKTF